MAESFSRALVIVAHPDDAELTCGGTVARWAHDGVEVNYVLATRGDKGTDDPDLTPERLASIREAEQRAAAAELGVRHVEFLDYGDGELVATLTMRKELTRLIRRYRPDVVITFDPTNRFFTPSGYFRHLNHPDHRVIGDVALDAVFPCARDRLSFRDLFDVEGLEPHKVREVYLVGASEPDTSVDISDFMETKLAAVSKHESQMKDMELVRARVLEKDRTDAEGEAARYAERFRRIVIE